MYIILVGGGNVGIELAKRLLEGEHEVLLLEKDSTHARRLASMLGDENVMPGDGCEMLVQKKAGFGRADVVVAVTGEDEDNLVVTQMAKVVWNVDRVLARVNDPDHESLFAMVGIDETVSATSIIYSLLEHSISPDHVLPVGALHRGNLEIVEVRISDRSPFVDHRVRDLGLPPETNIICLIRDEHGVAVQGDTMILEHDTVLAIVPREHAGKLRDMFEPMDR